MAEAEEVLARQAPGYLDRVRRASGRLAVRAVNPGDVQTALLGVEDASEIDLDVPTASRRPGVRAVKTVVKRLVDWELWYLGRQMTVLGESVARLGHALADRTEILEATTTRLGADMADLSERIARLEQRAPTREG